MQNCYIIKLKVVDEFLKDDGGFILEWSVPISVGTIEQAIEYAIKEVKKDAREDTEYTGEYYLVDEFGSVIA